MAWQAVLDEAWRIGMRPKGFADHTNELTAVRYHLEDMRAMAKVPERFEDVVVEHWYDEASDLDLETLTAIAAGTERRWRGMEGPIWFTMGNPIPVAWPDYDFSWKPTPKKPYIGLYPQLMNGVSLGALGNCGI